MPRARARRQRPRHRHRRRASGRPWAAIDAGADEFGAASAGTRADFYFSTAGNTNPPGVTGTADDADIYRWNGTAFTRAIGTPPRRTACRPAPNVDGFARVDADALLRVVQPTTPPCPASGAVQDEDVVYYDDGTWSMCFDGTRPRPVGGDQRSSTPSASSGRRSTSPPSTTAVPPGAGGTADNADVYRWNGGAAATPGSSTPRSAVRPAELRLADRRPTPTWTACCSTDATHFCDVVQQRHRRPCPGAGDGPGRGRRVLRRRRLVGVVRRHRRRADRRRPGHRRAQPAHRRRPDAARRRRDPLFYSTLGNANPPGAGGTADDADVYGWNGTGAHAGCSTRRWPGVPAGANVDGLRPGRRHALLPLLHADTVRCPGLGHGAGRGRRATTTPAPGRCTSTARRTG